MDDVAIGFEFLGFQLDGAIEGFFEKHSIFGGREIVATNDVVDGIGRRA